MNHKLWRQLPTDSKRIVLETFYVTGYILGMEDAIKDLDDSGVFRDESYFELRGGYMKSIYEARETLQFLREMEKGNGERGAAPASDEADRVDTG